METISLKLDASFAELINVVMKKHHFATKTEFVREALRDKVQELQALETIEKTHGVSRRKTTDTQLHAVRKKAFAQV